MVNCDAYGIIVGYEGDVAIIHSLKEALSELEAKHFPQKQITMWSDINILADCDKHSTVKLTLIYIVSPDIFYLSIIIIRV